MKKSILWILAILIPVSLFGQAPKPWKKMNVAIFIYDKVEILDFTGPGEVFASANADSEDAFNVYTVAAVADPILSQGFITVTPQYTIANCPKPDIIVLPGGDGRKSAEDPAVRAWVEKNSRNCTAILTVCTGLGILAKTGLLDGKEATTWYGAIDRYAATYPKIKFHKNTRFVDNGQIVTTAGVSAGIDGALHVVERLLGMDAALATAKYMEYDKWKPNEGLIISK